MVRPKAGIPKDRTYATTVGLRPRYSLGVHNHSRDNVLRGLTERVYRVERGGDLVPPPVPEPGVFAELLQFSEGVVRRVGRPGPWTYDEFILSCRGPKRTLYAQAVASLHATPISRKDAMLDTFVKAEKLDLTSKADPAPRLIQPRSPRYNAWVGRYVKRAEHLIYEAIDDIWGRQTVMSGYNALDVARHMRGHWDQWADTVAVGLDASRFDQHVSVPALEWEHSVYNGIYKDAELAQVLSWQLTNIGKARTPEANISYQVDGKRMSGDMNTSLGNKLIMCALVHRYARVRGVTCSLANNGDDCVVFMPRGAYRAFADGLAEWFLRFGFTMKVEPAVDVFEHIEFCQQRPVWDGSVWIMTRSPFKGLAKDTTYIGVNPTAVAKDYAQWAGGVGQAGLAAYGGIPVVQEVYARMATLGKRTYDDPYSGLGMASKGMKRQYHPPTAECRASYHQAWGLTPSAQWLMEHQIRGAAIVLEKPPSIESVDHYSITC